jgi:Uma2 family endonuclease
MSTVLDAPRTMQNAAIIFVAPPATALTAVKKAVNLALEEGVTVELANVSWGVYQAALQEFGGEQSPRFYYEKGNLLIMPTGTKHEDLNRALASLVEIACLEWGVEWCNFGSATFQHEDLAGGFEPDSCFYFQHEAAMRHKEQWDATLDPAPELVVEVDITSLSTGRQSIYAAFGVPEIWRCTPFDVAILHLVNGQYVEAAASLALPWLTVNKLAEFVNASRTLSRLEWLRQVQAWAREIHRENSL